MRVRAARLAPEPTRCSMGSNAASGASCLLPVPKLCLPSPENTTRDQQHHVISRARAHFPVSVINGAPAPAVLQPIHARGFGSGALPPASKLQTARVRSSSSPVRSCPLYQFLSCTCKSSKVSASSTFACSPVARATCVRYLSRRYRLLRSWSGWAAASPKLSTS